MGFRKADQTTENLPRSLPGSVQMDLWCQAQAGFYWVHEAVRLQRYHEISTRSEGIQHLNELSSITWILNCFAIQKISVSMQTTVQWLVLNYKVRKLPKKHHMCRRQERGYYPHYFLSALLQIMNKSLFGSCTITDTYTYQLWINSRDCMMVQLMGQIIAQK